MQPQKIVMSFNEYCALHNIYVNNGQFKSQSTKKHPFQPLKYPSIISDMSHSHDIIIDNEPQKSIDRNILKPQYSRTDWFESTNYNSDSSDSLIPIDPSAKEMVKQIQK
eukprot:298071_1